MARRSKLELYIDVLTSIKKRLSKPTNIMQDANLSWKSLQRILGDMCEQGFVIVVEEKSKRKRDRRSSRLYELSSKGLDLLSFFRGFRGSVGLDEVALVQW